MTSKPTMCQLETIAELGNARAPAARIAEALNVLPEAFTAWVGRLIATRELDEAAVTSLSTPVREHQV